MSGITTGLAILVSWLAGLVLGMLAVLADRPRRK